MLRELMLRGVSAKTQASFPVCYQGQYVGDYCADPWHYSSISKGPWTLTSGPLPVIRLVQNAIHD